MLFQMNLELTKIFKAKLLVCHCEIKFLTPLLMCASFLHIFSFNFMHHYSLLKLVTWLSQKGVSNTLIHLGDEAGFFFPMNILKASCHFSQLISLRFITGESELLILGQSLENFIPSPNVFNFHYANLTVFFYYFKCVPFKTEESCG